MPARGFEPVMGENRRGCTYRLVGGGREYKQYGDDYEYEQQSHDYAFKEQLFIDQFSFPLFD